MYHTTNFNKTVEKEWIIYMWLPKEGFGIILYWTLVEKLDKAPFIAF